MIALNFAPFINDTRKLVSDDFGRGFLLLLQFIHRCEKVKMISEQT